MMSATTKRKSSNKFDSIETTLDTGLHYGNIEIIPKRRGELFRRLKTTEMVTLLQLYLIEISKDTESISNLIQDNKDAEEEEEDHEEKSPVNNIFHHHEYPAKDEDGDNNKAPNVQTGISSVFLLLDIRDEAEFEQYHIKSARHYDMTTLRRDKLGNEIYAFKNKPNKIIIICCNEEKVGIGFANELCKKYIDNIFLLTTSVKRFCIKYPDLCVGHSFPQKPTDKKQPKARMHFVEWRPSNSKPATAKFNAAHSVKSMMSTCTTASVRTWKP